MPRLTPVRQRTLASSASAGRALPNYATSGRVQADTCASSSLLFSARTHTGPLKLLQVHQIVKVEHQRSGGKAITTLCWRTSGVNLQSMLPEYATVQLLAASVEALL